MTTRNCMRIGLIGVNGTGKSSFLRDKVLSAYNFARQTGVIVTETIDNPAFDKIYQVDTFEDLAKLKSGLVKFWDFESEDDFKLLIQLHDTIKKGAPQNGVICFEDCTNYIDANPHRIVKKFAVNHRMFNLDLVFTTHALTDMPKFLRKRLNTITVFKTGDNFTKFEQLQTLGYTNAKPLYEAWVKVMNDPNDYANLTIKCL